MKKIFFVFLFFGIGVCWYLAKSDVKKSDHVGHAVAHDHLLKKESPDRFAQAQDKYLQWVQSHPIRIERHYGQNLKTDEQDLLIETQRQQDSQLQIIAEINDDKAPEISPEEKRMLIQMMASEGVRSAYAHDQ